MAARNATRRERSKAVSVDDHATEAAARLASSGDAAIPSPVRHLQAQLEVDLAQADDARRWPPAAALLLAGIPSVAIWWGVIAGARALVHALAR